MKLAVIGATSPTGQCILQQAAEKGYEVVAIVRTPSKNKITHEKVKVVTGNIFDGDDLAQHLKGCDAVISCLGPPIGLATVFKENTLYTNAAKATVAAMEKNNMTRYVFITGWGIDNHVDLPLIWKMAFRTFFRNMVLDAQRMEKYVKEECPTVEYTSVRAPELTNGNATDGEVPMEGGTDYSKNMQMKMSRTDLARVILKIVEENLFIRDVVTVGSAK